MTLDEVKALAETTEGRSWLESIPMDRALQYVSPDEVQNQVMEAKKPLLTKQEALLAETKKAKEERNALRADMENNQRFLHLLEDFNIGVDDEGKLDYTRVEEMLRDVKSGKGGAPDGASGAEIAEVNRRLKKSQREFEAKQKEIALKENDLQVALQHINTRDAFIHDLLINEKMQAALAKVGYPQTTIETILPALVRESGAQVHYDESIEEVSQRWSAITNDNQTIGDWVKYWSTTEKGLHFMPGRQNVGGGAGGSGGRSTPKSWNEMSFSERDALHRNSPETYRQLRDAHNKR